MFSTYNTELHDVRIDWDDAGRIEFVNQIYRDWQTRSGWEWRQWLSQVVTYTADDDGYHAQVEYHGDITHHPHSHLPTPDYHHSQPPPPPPPPVDYPQHPPPPPPAKPLKIYKYSPVAKPPAGPPPLLPKLFVPQDPPKLRKPPPALKLEKAGPHSPHLAGVVRARQYSYSPTPYPAHQVRTPIYKGKIVFVDKPWLDDWIKQSLLYLIYLLCMEKVLLDSSCNKQKIREWLFNPFTN